MLGWLGNAFFSFLYHAVPADGKACYQRPAGTLNFRLVEFRRSRGGLAAGLAGFSKPLEWAEFPLVIDVFVVLALLVAAIQFVPPFFSRRAGVPQ
jgi:cbb3-type cytochrome oxidase subunit 1